MEPPSFWRERASRFKALADERGARDLYATLNDLPTYLAASSDSLRVAIREVIQNKPKKNKPKKTPPKVDLEHVYECARTVAHAGRILLDPEPHDRWIVSGGPKDPRAHARLLSRFQAEVRMAAIGAGVANATMSDQAVLEAWFDLILRTKSLYFLFGDVLEHFIQTSADMCPILEAQTYGEAHARALQGVDVPQPAATAPVVPVTPAPPSAPSDAPPSPETAPSVPMETPVRPSPQPAKQARFPNRAAWLTWQMTEREIAKTGFKKLGGPDRKSIDSIRSGVPVHWKVLNKLAKALGVPREDVPDN